MTQAVKRLLQKAMKLPASGRAELARQLIASLEPELADDPAEVARAWRDEIARRVEDVEKGRVKLIPAKVVHEEVRRALARRRSRRK